MSRVLRIDGLPIINARAPITLTVNDKDIEGGDIKKPDQCAFARCCRRAAHAKEVRVHLGRVYIRTNNTNWVRFITPPSLRTEIIAFDRGGEFAPGSYTLPAPSKAKRTGKRQGSNKSTPRAGKKRRKPHIVTNVRTGPA